MTPCGRARALLVPLAVLAGALIMLACGDGASAGKPAPAAIATAESLSRPAEITAPLSTTPEKDDAGKTPIALVARIFGSGATGVILAHERPADQTSWFAFATQLAAGGEFTVLTFNFRGYGESTGEKSFDRIDTDLMAAYVYARDNLKLKKIFLVGASTGGTASLVVAAEVPVAGVVSISAPQQFETMDALAAVPDIDAPKLFITSKDDVPAERSLEDLVDAADEPKDQEIYDGNANGTDLFAGPHAAELERRLSDFLRQH